MPAGILIVIVFSVPCAGGSSSPEIPASFNDSVVFFTLSFTSFNAMLEPKYSWSIGKPPLKTSFKPLEGTGKPSSANLYSPNSTAYFFFSSSDNFSPANAVCCSCIFDCKDANNSATVPPVIDISLGTTVTALDAVVPISFMVTA